ncbi:hypothetical protein ACET3Z_001246 [Daucus carota]
MQVAGQVRAIAAEASVTNKRRRLHSAQPNSSTVHHPLPNHCCCSSVSVSPKNSVSPTTPFEFPDQVPQTSLCLHNQSITTISISSDLKADENSGTDEISKSTSDAFSDEKTEQVMESMTKKRRKISQATSIDASKMPSTEEIEDFFSVAEMLQKKRFMEKYNYDIVKDVALEGRYQWVRVKPC